ncbi:hypothetical protein CCP3SC5AM1_250017 [Gammaproteobacteria bacterium]
MYDDNGNAVSLPSMVQDITHDKCNEMELQLYRDHLEQLVKDRTWELQEARNNAERLLRVKTEFLNNMNHEIRTPLNAILGFAQVLERDSSLLPRQAEHIRSIIRSGAHLLKLINDIFDMSKINAGQVTLNPTIFCLHDMLNDLESMFRFRSQSKGLEFVLERDSNVPRRVFADENKLRQILANLIENAIKFTTRGKIVTRLRAEAVTAKAWRLWVEVEDTGPGIPAKEINAIFTAFHQADVGINQEGGVGLGLAISRQFVEMMGGVLKVTSKVGQGSFFGFDVLLTRVDDECLAVPNHQFDAPSIVASNTNRETRNHPPRVIGLKPGTGPVRALIVDDESVNRAILRELLKPVGFDINEASNGLAALEIFEHWQPSVVLMDLRMPIMDGYETTRRIKLTMAGRTTPIIMVTASIFTDDKLTGGVDAFLRKPFKVEELFETIGRCLNLHYIFANDVEPTPATASTSVALPLDFVNAMRQAISEGDIAHLMELIDQAETLNGDAARTLRTIANQYDYDGLLVCLNHPTAKAGG